MMRSSLEWEKFQRSEARMEKIEKLFPKEFYWVDAGDNIIWDIKDLQKDMYYEVRRVF